MSKAREELVEELDRLGIRWRGHPFTQRKISDLQERYVISVDWNHPGRPIGGSSTRYRDGTVPTIEAVAREMDEEPDTDRAILVAALKGARIPARGVLKAWAGYFEKFNNAVERLRMAKRVRLPSALLPGP